MLRWLVRRSCAVLSYSTVPRRKHAFPPLCGSKHNSSYTTPTAPESASGTSDVPLQEEGKERAAEARSLLRALLREGTYLSDGFARQRVKQHACSSFRACGHKAHGEHAPPVSKERITKKLKDGRRALSKLQRANDGHTQSMQKVLMAAYGRTGKRRRELLQPLLLLSRDNAVEASSNTGDTTAHKPDEPPADQELRVQTEDRKSNTALPNPAVTHDQSQSLSPQLHSLLLSQIQHAPPTLTRSNPRRLQPVIPELNTWLRPMPQKRVRNMQKEHYAKLLSQALPPLPRSEWERLRDLASGKVELEPQKSRRSQVDPDNAPDHSAMYALDVVIRFGKVPLRLKRQKSRGPISRRTMRRLYAKVFSQCPLMQYDEQKESWHVTWGGQAMLDTHNGQES